MNKKYKFNDKISHERLKSLIEYDPETGQWKWLIARRGVAAGSIPNNISTGGRRRISIDRVSYLSSRLAWFYMTGNWPTDDIDHHNRIRDDDRWENLRLATRSQNLANRRKRRSGLKGVTFYKRHRKKPWSACISDKGKRIHLGYYESEVEAHQVYLEAAKAHYGEFASGD